MDGREEGVRKIGHIDNPKFQEFVDRSVECTDCEFECNEIVGRKFESIDDHAAYLGGGDYTEGLRRRIYCDEQ